MVAYLLLVGAVGRKLHMAEAVEATRQVVHVARFVVRGEGVNTLEVTKVPQLEDAVAVSRD